jgi:osmotically inducible protein OsmC
MASAARRAEATWEGDLMSGSGVVSAVSSGAFTELPVSWAARTERSDGRASPEELVAAAHASCYCMALSNGLGDSGTPPSRLEVSATVTFEQVHQGWKVTSSTLLVRGRVPGGDPVSFRQAAETAKDGCPISVALQGNVELNVEATLLE